MIDELIVKIVDSMINTDILYQKMTRKHMCMLIQLHWKKY